MDEVDRRPDIIAVVHFVHAVHYVHIRGPLTKMRYYLVRLR